MLRYNKLSRSTRTRAALLLLLLFMVLTVADLFISFFGGSVLGVLLVQLEWEMQRFFKPWSSNSPKVAGIFRSVFKRYKSLSKDHKLLLKAGLQALVLILVLVGVLDTFWGGLFSGILLTLLIDSVLRYQQLRSRQKITIKKN
ncbi:hypothetical protein POKO110462_16915 [Pontibacter korlensis]|uniref:Uncharacterized protein n=1 Tax=Pontibacter korlensis TaxID=400092 RepID=A0A0E3UWE3_9BACT|nr:hypothetical protein [Pontibacter korlensis]AKD03332.1 hypothetical protein PKOR_09630 [Pontibacter korlensis]